MSNFQQGEPIRVAVFASGRGSTFQAIHRVLAATENAPARIVLCVSNNPRPGAFEYAESVGIRTLRCSPKMFETDEAYTHELMRILSEHGVELVVLAGYMRQLPAVVVGTYRGRMLNIHPALLPKYGGKGMYGAHVHEAVLAAGETESGPTVHFVDEEYDTGPVVAQERVPVLPEDTPESLAARVLEVEHHLYPRVVLQVAGDMLREKEIGNRR